VNAATDPTFKNQGANQQSENTVRFGTGKAEEDRRPSFIDDELDAIAAALNVPVDLLLD
jgi:hypothetical protein